MCAVSRNDMNISLSSCQSALNISWEKARLQKDVLRLPFPTFTAFNLTMQNLTPVLKEFKCQQLRDRSEDTIKPQLGGTCAVPIYDLPYRIMCD